MCMTDCSLHAHTDGDTHSDWYTYSEHLAASEGRGGLSENIRTIPRITSSNHELSTLYGTHDQAYLATPHSYTL